MQKSSRVGSPGKKADKGIGSVVIGVLMTALLLMGGLYPLCSMADDFMLHFSGVVARTSDCRIDRYRTVRNRYTDLVVDYETADGSQQHARSSLSFFLWPRNPDDSVPCEVRYKPDSPGRFSSTWGFSRLPSRLATYLVLEVWLLLAGVFIVIDTLKSLWRRMRPRRS